MLQIATESVASTHNPAPWSPVQATFDFRGPLGCRSRVLGTGVYRSPVSDWVTVANAEVVTAWASIGAAAIAGVAALVGLGQLRMIRRDSRERTRPYVQVDVVPGLQGPGFWDLIVENKGASGAYDVTVEVGALPPADAADHIVEPLEAFLSSPRVLVPGARRRVMWAMQVNGERAGVLEAKLVKVRYYDLGNARKQFRKRAITEEFLLEDCTALAAGAYPAPIVGSTSSRSDDLKDLNLAVRTLNTHVGELRR